MSIDRIERLGNSLIQHGPQNDRVYLLKLGKEDLPEIAGHLVEMAKDRGYSKIFAKIPVDSRRPFIDSGYVEEARIPGFYKCTTDGLFLSRFLSPTRETENQPELVAEVLETARGKRRLSVKPGLAEGQRYGMMCQGDVEEMAELYRQVFDSYPFPINDPAYLQKTMDENLIYFGIWADDRLVALSSAEIDFANQNAEMTDFATLPAFRGQGLANFLLEKMEAAIRQLGIRTAYTIARAYSYGMNITFAKQGYLHGGTLTANTQISGGLETMNVWYKPL